MEDTYRRKRYVRDGYSRNRRNKNVSKGNFTQNIIKQMLACFIIFIIIFGLKGINTPITNKIMERIKDAITYTTNINMAYKSIETFSQSLGLNGKDTENDETIKENEMLQDNIENNIEDNDNLEKQKQLKLEARENIPTDIEKESIEIYQSIVAPLNGVITSGFGMRKHPLNQKELFHYGIDIDGKKGEDIVAAIDGEVLEVGYNDTYGNYVKLKHNEDVHTFYAHCSDIPVEKGQRVKMNQAIAKVGDTGLVSGPHLHFEIWKGDKVLDPSQYIQLAPANSGQDA